MNLDAYFARIGYTGPREATLATLRALQLLHVGAIPFENLDVLLGRGVKIDLESVEQKLVHAHRGGYCFEQNTLFAAVLRALGFHVTPLLGRVRWNKPADVRTGLTHMILRVEVDGRPWLADVGFGSVGPSGPLALDTTDEQATPHEPRRLMFDGARVVQQCRIGDTWGDVYEFQLEESGPVDLEMGNWYSCTHPTAHFLNALVAARCLPDRRVLLCNRELTIRQRDGRVEKRDLVDADDLLAVLATHFDLHFPAGTRFNKPGAPWPM
jgi:N-hydroxyarylamine O-acetyltransferase